MCHICLDMQSGNEIKAFLEWQLAMGVDELIQNIPNNRMAEAQRAINRAIALTEPTITPPPEAPAISSVSLAETVSEARKLSDAADSLETLRNAVVGFDGCSLKKTARNTVFADGAANSDVMLIGEAPGADEDRQGIPFCGASGQLLDKMLASIGLNRQENCYITNTLFWRPPGNRTPTPDEIEICRPFVERHIELFAPKLMILIGGTAAKSLLKETSGIKRLRGSTLSYQHPKTQQSIDVRVIFHPSYLLRQPLQKKLAWQDLLEIQSLVRD